MGTSPHTKLAKQSPMFGAKPLADPRHARNQRSVLPSIVASGAAGVNITVPVDTQLIPDVDALALATSRDTSKFAARVAQDTETIATETIASMDLLAKTARATAVASSDAACDFRQLIESSNEILDNDVSIARSVAKDTEFIAATLDWLERIIMKTQDTPKEHQQHQADVTN